ncbi:ParB/RepB/Spo0J family partition protein [Candidatus Saccharibacteria bacterium]|jgi:ParB family chromosome partitioning protein|nr:ParB/RepB/Spo0J family partition protein [Candidatus Saccharibacteria bacterium]
MKKGLGRNFESLIPVDLLDESFDPTAATDEQISDLRNIKLAEITADPDQPRRHFDDEAMAELTSSIEQHGVLQPIVVVPFKGKYQIVAGERRFRASIRAGKHSIPALVRTLSAQHKLELSLIENIQRHDLNPIEMATAYGKLRDQFNLTLEEIGTRVGGKSVSAISNTLRLLRLPHSAKQAVARGDITEGQARPLVGADAQRVDELLPIIIKEGWSARKIEQISSSVKPIMRARPASEKMQFIDEANTLSNKLKTTVKIHATQRGAGAFTIAFTSDVERQRIQSLLEK